MTNSKLIGSLYLENVGNIAKAETFESGDPIASSRRIRSFVRREGRITPAQQRALQVLWPRFGVATESGLLNSLALFGRLAPLVLEIGFGDGESLARMAEADPEANYLGVEVHRPGIGHLLLRAEALALSNLRVICADAVAVLEQRIADASLDRVQIFFPDPWPKARQQKRRLIQPTFVSLLGQKLKPGGLLHIATDWADYARAIREALHAAAGFIPWPPEQGASTHPVPRPLTRFEQRGMDLGHPIQEILATRT